MFNCIYFKQVSFKINNYSSWLEMQNCKSMKDSSKITSYNQFLQMVKDQKSMKKSQNNINVGENKNKKKLVDKSTNKKSINKCITQTAQINQNQFKSSIENHFISRQSNSNVNSNAFMSIQNIKQPQNYTNINHNKQNIFTQRRSCSKNPYNSQYELNQQIKMKQNLSHINHEGVAHFLLNQILLIVQQITKFNRQRITYLDFLQILRQLNMIQNNYQPSKQDHVYKLWGILTAYNKQNTTCLINLTLIILAVMNIRGKSKSIKQFFQNVCYSTDSFKTNNLSFKKVNSNTSKNIQQYKKNKQGYFDLTKQEVYDIYKQFKQLRVTRMYLGRINKKSQLIQEKTSEYSKYSFKPEISQRSKSLAKCKRQKQFLNLQSINHDIIQYQIKTQRQKKQLEQCTFQPNSSRICDTPISKSIGKKRSELLYKMGKSKSKEKKKDRKADQIQFQKNQQIFTFKPQLISTKKSSQKFKKQIGNKVQGQNKQIDRMIKARLQKQVKTRALQRGIPYNEKQINKLRKKITQQILTKKVLIRKNNETKQLKIQQNIQGQKKTNKYKQQQEIQSLQSIRQQTKQRRQIFTFEVYLEQNTCVDKITIYEGDVVQQVARDFILKHNLKESMQVKLITSLKSHLAQILQQNNLCKIDEQSVQYSIEC